MSSQRGLACSTKYTETFFFLFFFRSPTNFFYHIIYYCYELERMSYKIGITNIYADEKSLRAFVYFIIDRMTGFFCGAFLTRLVTLFFAGLLQRTVNVYIFPI